MDHGSQYRRHFTNQIKFWGIVLRLRRRAPDQRRRQRFNRTLKEQIIHGRIYRNIAELRDAVRDFVELYNAHRRKERLPEPRSSSSGVAISIRPAANLCPRNRVRYKSTTQFFIGWMYAKFTPASPWRMTRWNDSFCAPSFHLRRFSTVNSGSSESRALAWSWQSQMPLSGDRRWSGVISGSYRGPPGAAAEMWAATPTLISSPPSETLAYPAPRVCLRLIEEAIRLILLKTNRSLIHVTYLTSGDGTVATTKKPTQTGSCSHRLSD